MHLWHALGMKRALSGVLGLGMTALVLLYAGPANAQQVSVDDEAGDASGPGLDIARVTVDNQDRAVVVKIRFASTGRGDLIVSLDPRGGRGVRLVSEYRPVSHTRNIVVGRAFTDHGGSGRPVPCPGFGVTWSAERPTARLRMPSTCLGGGDYGAIRFAVLTESAGGSDTDAAPENGASDWVSRG
jgi:hypothetical protein